MAASTRAYGLLQLLPSFSYMSSSFISFVSNGIMSVLSCLLHLLSGLRELLSQFVNGIVGIVFSDAQSFSLRLTRGESVSLNLDFNLNQMDQNQ